MKRELLRDERDKNEPMALLDGYGHILDVNQQLLRESGLDPEGLRGLPFFRLMPRQSTEVAMDVLRKTQAWIADNYIGVIRPSPIFPIVLPTNDPEHPRSIRIVQITPTPRRDNSLTAVCAIKDITHLSIDPLTGLFNNQTFDILSEHSLLEAQQRGLPLSFLMMDIDHFKAVNDTYKHAGGDLVIQAVGESIMHSIRQGVDFGGRYGGDENQIVISDSTISVKLAKRIRAKIQRKLKQTVQIDATVSMGIATYDPSLHGTAVTLKDLREMADTALSFTKSFLPDDPEAQHGGNPTGRNGVSILINSDRPQMLVVNYQPNGDQAIHLLDVSGSQPTIIDYHLLFASNRQPLSDSPALNAYFQLGFANSTAII